jgi:hypothetical protein
LGMARCAMALNPVPNGRAAEPDVTACPAWRLTLRALRVLAAGRTFSFAASHRP